MLNTNYTAEDDRVFWAFLIIANIWIAAGTGPVGRWGAVPYLLLCVAIRWPIWRAFFQRAA